MQNPLYVEVPGSNTNGSIPKLGSSVVKMVGKSSFPPVTRPNVRPSAGSGGLDPLRGSPTLGTIDCAARADDRMFIEAEI